MSLPDPRALSGVRFGLSISASPDMAGRDDPERAVNSLTFRLASSILLEGGALLLGHRWSPDGIMEHLAFKARDSRSSGVRRPGDVQDKAGAPILNLVAWPDVPPSDDRNAQRMIRDGVLDVRQVLPPGIPLDRLDPDPARALESDVGQFARMRALTAMRQEMVRHTDTRVCLGGGAGKSMRRLPGVIEEAILTCVAGKPICISGALGGAAKAMADAILHRRLSDDARALFFTPPAAVGLLAAQGAQYPVAAEEGPSIEDGWSALDYLQAIPLAQLGRQSGLSEEEYVQLLTSTDVQRALGLAIAGIIRLRSSASPAAPERPPGA
ncbi:MAG: hypothetical protein WCF44_15755 [Candidatus Methylophosphatis roskildensis]